MKIIQLFSLIFLFLSCNDGQDENSTTIEQADTLLYPMKDRDSAYEVMEAKGYYVWDVNVLKKTLKKNPDLSDEPVNVDAVIAGLNSRFAEIQLKKLKQGNDTIFLTIPESDYLTNQSGTSGADQYIAQAVINLAAVPGINFAHIDFKPGEHLMPGTWSRKNFPGYIIIQ